MLAGKKGKTEHEEQGLNRRLRNKKVTYSSPQSYQDRSHGPIWTAHCPERIDVVCGDRKTYKGNHKKMSPTMYNRGRPKNLAGLNSGEDTGIDYRSSSAGSNLSNYRIQINKFIESLEEYKKMEMFIKNNHDTLVGMRQELLNSADVELDEIPDVQSSIQDIFGGIEKKNVSVESSRPIVSEKESDTLDLEEDNKWLEEALRQMAHELKLKDDELNKLRKSDITKTLIGGESGIQEIETLRQTIVKLDQENRVMQEKLKQCDFEREEGREDQLQKVKSLERLIESLHVELKRLKDYLKIEKEIRHKLEKENENLTIEINELKSRLSPDSKYIILDKDAKIQELQNKLNETLRIWPHPSSSNQNDVFKVDFSTETSSIVNQLVNFVQLYEDLSREGLDLESKLKESHLEIYRLEQILEKQLIKIKEQDDCLKNMEESLSKVIVETRRSSRVDHDSSTPGKCLCEEYQNIIKEREEFSEKLKEKMSLLYQKYKQYKAECNLMRKKCDAFENRSWLKKLVNI